MCTGGLLIALGLSLSIIHHPILSTLFAYLNLSQALEAAGAGELQKEKEREKEKGQVRLIIIMRKTLMMSIIVVIMTLKTMMLLTNDVEGDQAGRGSWKAFGDGEEGEKGAGEGAQ